jgi:hypothetical protein
LSEDLQVRKVVKSAQTAKNAELEVVVNSQVEKIAELEMVYADLKCEKESITTGYQKLSDKHKTFTEKAEWEKVVLVESYAMKLAKLRGDLDLETCIYTKYRLNIRRWLHELHNTVASSFD